MTAADILKMHNLRLTEGRREILDVIKHSKRALSHPEVEERLQTHVDRITTYRTLQSFKKKGIVHSIVDPHSGTAKDIFSDVTFPRHHAHFKCITYGIVVCLIGEIEKADLVRLPNEYKALQYSFVIEGCVQNAGARLFIARTQMHQ